MTLQEAITARHAVRSYLDKPIEDEKIKAIQECIDLCNREGGLHIQLIINNPKAFASSPAGTNSTTPGTTAMIRFEWYANHQLRCHKDFTCWNIHYYD